MMESEDIIAEQAATISGLLTELIRVRAENRALTRALQEAHAGNGNDSLLDGDGGEPDEN